MPKLRFRDSKGNNFLEWLYKSIKDIGTVYTGNTPTTSCLEYYGNEYPWITPSDIQSDSVIFSSKKMLSERGYQKCRQLPAGAVLITCIASIGKNVILGKAGSCNQQINAIVPKEDMSSYFILYALTMKTKDLLSLGGNGGMKIVKKSIFEKMLIPVPSLPEQQKIADFLSSYDEKISIQRERVESLERRKKGLLQKVFSQEIRFKADDGIEFPAWTLKALGDIFSFKNGLNASRDSFENGNIPCIGVYDICRCAPITENAIRGYVSVDSNIKESFRVNFGDVLFQRSSETLQDVGHACVYIGKESVVYNGFVIKGTPKKQRQYIPEFIHWMLQSDFVRRQAIAFGAGAQHYNIGQESISSIIGYFPCVAEQKKIAKLFTAVDDQMNIEKERLSTMETIKKGLIQGLFC